jgi:hypothetical protein
MHDKANRLAFVDLTGAPRLVVASDEHGNINPDAAALLPVVPIPYVTSAEAGWSNSLLRPNRLRLAPRTGFAPFVEVSKSRRAAVITDYAPAADRGT